MEVAEHRRSPSRSSLGRSSFPSVPITMLRIHTDGSIPSQRIRDVREGPEGAIYLLTDEDDGQILRLVRGS